MRDDMLLKLVDISIYVNKEIYLHIKSTQAHDDFENMFNEFLKFMYISSITDKKFIPVTKEIDDIWHEYILQTKAYSELCLSLPGKKFINHKSISFDQYCHNNSKDVVIKDMVSWVPLYKEYFGPFLEKNANYWFLVKFLINELDMKLCDINLIA